MRQVFLARDMRTGEKVAIKKMQINQKNKMEYLVRRGVANQRTLVDAPPPPPRS